MHMFLYLLWIFRELLVFISAIAHVYLKTSMCSHSNRFCVRLCYFEKLFFALMFIYILSVFDFLFGFFVAAYYNGGDSVTNGCRLCRFYRSKGTGGG